MNEFSIIVASELVQSAEEFPVDFDKLWEWVGYNQKSDAKKSLINNFEEKFDYDIVKFRQSPQSDNHADLSPQEKAVLARKEW